MDKQKILFLGDPYYSSLAHIARITGLFRQLKRIDEIDVCTRMLSLDNSSGSHLNKLNRKSVENGWLDSIVTINTDNSERMDFNRAADLREYFSSNVEIFASQYRQKIDYINHIHTEFDKIIIVTSPGTFGALITTPVVPKNVHNILILDTFYHPASEIFVGTGWRKKSLLGKLQARFLVPRYALSYIRDLNRLRSKLGVPAITGKTLFNSTVIDPNVPAYSKTLYPVKNYYQIGPIYNNQEQDKVLEDKIQDFKGSNRLVYITLGGSASQHEFISWISRLIAHLRTELGEDIRYLITTGKSIDPDKVKASLNRDINDCWIDSYVDIQQLAPHLDLMIGTFGQGQLLMAAKNKCPVIVCPINADQTTHAALVTRLKIGARPYRTKLLHLRASSKLIQKVLDSDKNIAATAAKILKYSSQYQNDILAQQLQDATEDYQFKVARKVVQHICAPHHM